jgi:hypothetical protein
VHVVISSSIPDSYLHFQLHLFHNYHASIFFFSLFYTSESTDTLTARLRGQQLFAYQDNKEWHVQADSIKALREMLDRAMIDALIATVLHPSKLSENSEDSETSPDP